MTEPCTERDDSRRREFERVVLVHLDALYNLALRTTREPFAAEDLVQDTMVRAYRFFERYQEGTNCKAWLFAILRNTWINRYHKTAKTPHTVAFDAIEEQTGRPLPSPLYGGIRSPEESTADGRLAEALRKALDGLPAEFRMAAVLSIVEGLSYKEVADVMSCPIGTVMSRLHRARRMLQEALHSHAAERGLIGRTTGLPPAAPARRFASAGLQLSAS
jgi:RNA polymerase sigma-70 factor (ECF subfamily)